MENRIKSNQKKERMNEDDDEERRRRQINFKRLTVGANAVLIVSRIPSGKSPAVAIIKLHKAENPSVPHAKSRTDVQPSSS